MYPNTPGSKTGGASREAAERITGRAAKLRVGIEDLMAKGYRLTADEIAEQLSESVLAIRPRVSELVKAGVLVKTKDRRPNKSGMTAHVMHHRDAAVAVELPKPEPKTPKGRRGAAAALHPDQVALFGSV